MLKSILIACSALALLVVSNPAAAQGRYHGRNGAGYAGGGYYGGAWHGGYGGHYRYVGWRRGFAYPFPSYSHAGWYGYLPYAHGFPTYSFAVPSYGYPNWYVDPAHGSRAYAGPEYDYDYDCGDPVVGAVAGAAAAATIGGVVAVDGRAEAYGYSPGGDVAASAAIGGILGAIIGDSAAAINC